MSFRAFEDQRWTIGTMVKFTRDLVLILLIGVTFGSLSHSKAEETSLSQISVEGVWARATFAGAKNGAAYLILQNHGSTTDRLVGLSSSVSERTEVHHHTFEKGSMIMRRLTNVQVEAGSPLVFQPGGLHIMLIGLKNTLAEGDEFKLILTFEHAGDLTKNVKVQSIISTKYSQTKSDEVNN